MISRRNFTRLALGAIASKSPGASVVNGVALGATGYSFASLSLGEAIEAMTKIGIGNCEVWSRHIEPKLPREELREWRLSAPLELYRQAGEEFRRANIAMIALTFDMKDDFTDGELERVFQMTKALGVNRIATSTTFMVAERITPLMKQFRTEVAFHGHSNAADPNQFAGPDSFRRVLRMSPYAKINLDIGQFVAAGFDPVAFLKEQHKNIPMLHIRDGEKGRGTKLAWGTGATPIREVLRLLQRERWGTVADVEYDYGGPLGTVAEVNKCFRYCVDTLTLSGS